jgi:two-component system sensor histidine kinase YesM
MLAVARKAENFANQKPVTNQHLPCWVSDDRVLAEDQLMPNTKFTQFFNSIHVKLSAGLILFLLPILILSVFNNIYVNRYVRKQIAATQKSAAELFMNQIDDNLNSIDQYLVDLATEAQIRRIYDPLLDDNDYYLTVLDLSNRINKNILLYQLVDSIFIYNLEKDETIYALNSRATYSESLAINKVVKAIIQGDLADYQLNTTRWQPVQVDQGYYLLRIIRNDKAYVGIWIKLTTIRKFILEDSEFPAYILVNNQAAPMDHQNLVEQYQINLQQNYQNDYLTGSGKTFLMVGVYSVKGDFALVTAVPYRIIFSSNKYIGQVFILLAVSLAIFLPIYLLILRRTVLRPITQIIGAMGKVSEGDLTTRIPPIRTSIEFNTVNLTFNNMLEQIQKLKIDIYEEKISKQRVALERLQLQVKPHFFLNSLNTINTMARLGKIDLLLEFNKYLIGYFRYMFRSDMSYVSLGEEINHVENYIRIQELHFPKRLMATIDVDDYLRDQLVPPLLIHTFAENTVKYALSAERPIEFSVSGDLHEVEGKQFVRLLIRDTGDGFAPVVLQKLQKGEPLTDEYGKHIGIYNLRERLKSFYKDPPCMTFRNQISGGAEIEILLPYGKNNIGLRTIL